MKSNYIKGVFFLILSAFFFALMAAFVKLSGEVPFVEKTIFRNSISFLVALGSIIISVKKQGFKTIIPQKECFKYLFIRAFAGTAAIFGNFYAIDHLILADAGILNKLSPFFAILFSLILIHEKIKFVPLFSIITAFAASLLVIKPSFNFSQSLPSFAGLLGGVGAGLAYACVRKLGLLKCNGNVVIFCFSAFSVLVSLPFVIFNFQPLTLKQFIYLVLSGLCAAGGQFSITKAYYNAKASEISIYDYTQIFFSSALGFIFFKEIPDLLSFIGYIVIISMALLNFFYVKKQNKKDSESALVETKSNSNTNPESNLKE